MRHNPRLRFRRYHQRSPSVTLLRRGSMGYAQQRGRRLSASDAASGDGEWPLLHARLSSRLAAAWALYSLVVLCSVVLLVHFALVVRVRQTWCFFSTLFSTIRSSDFTAIVAVSGSWRSNIFGWQLGFIISLPFLRIGGA